MKDKNKNNIVLIGMPGAGKSTLGVVAAKMLNMKFLDVDLLIQEVCGCVLPVLINRLGTQGFIEKESSILQGIKTSSPTIISTGGSAIYTSSAMEHLKSIGRVIYLRVSFEELISRIGCESMEARGVVLQNASTSSTVQLKDVYDQRIPLYEKYADLTLDVDGLLAGEAAQKLLDLLYEN